MFNKISVLCALLITTTSAVYAGPPVDAKEVERRINLLAPVVGSTLDGSIVAGTRATGCPATLLIPSTTRASNGTPFSTGTIVTTGATNPTDGRPNTVTLNALQVAAGATGGAQTCTALNEDGATNWYLPAVLELACVLPSISAWQANTTTGGNNINTGINIAFWHSTHLTDQLGLQASQMFLEFGEGVFASVHGTQTSTDASNHVLCVRRAPS